MGGCQNYGPFWGSLNNRCRIIIGTQKGTIILTTTHMGCSLDEGPLFVPKIVRHPHQKELKRHPSLENYTWVVVKIMVPFGPLIQYGT